MRELLSTKKYLLFFALSAAFSHQKVKAAGGIAEMKALTGDAPYLGTGNQEQAPEYFGEAAYRQYYNGGANDYPGSGYRSRYAYNAMNSLTGGGQYGNYGGGYRLPYRGYGGRYDRYGAGAVGYGGGPRYTVTDYTVPVVANVAPVGGGGFYTGSGNEWARRV